MTNAKIVVAHILSSVRNRIAESIGELVRHQDFRKLRKTFPNIVWYQRERR